MIECRVIPGTDAVEFTIDGEVTEDAYDRVFEVCAGVIETWGSLRVLKVIRSIDAVDPRVFLRELAFGFRHLGAVSRAGVVADARVIQIWTRLGRPFAPFEVALFELDELDAARAWLLEFDTAGSG